MGKNICKQSDWQGITLWNTQTVHEVQYEKKSQSNYGQKIKTDTLQRRHTGGQKAHEKMVNISNY